MNTGLKVFGSDGGVLYDSRLVHPVRYVAQTKVSVANRYTIPIPLPPEVVAIPRDEIQLFFNLYDTNLLFNITSYSWQSNTLTITARHYGADYVTGPWGGELEVLFCVK